MVMMATAMGVSAQQAADPATMDQSALDAMMSVINGVPRLQWSIVKRGFWVNSVDNLRDFLVTTLRYTPPMSAEHRLPHPGDRGRERHPQQGRPDNSPTISATA